MSESGKIRVLIVDDSAFMCRVLQSIINADPQLEVIGTARDGREAVSAAETLKPDVITMDINMPHVDGLQATEVIMSTNPRPIVIVSSESRDGAEPTLKSLELGAIDFVTKPSAAIDLDMNTVRAELCRKLKVASKVRVVRNASRVAMRPTTTDVSTADAGTTATLGLAKIGPGGNGDGNSAKGPAPGAAPVFSSTPARATERFPVVVVAASTGGPQTLMRLVPQFSGNFPGAVLLIQHMPGAFTSKFSQQLAEISPLNVKEAEQGELMKPGSLYVCPGSHHLRVSPTGRITLDDGPRVAGYRPCADLAMETVATFAGPMATAVVLTGMGADGSRGVRAVKNSGGFVLAQDEATSVIFGMPSEAIKTGAVDAVLGIDAIYPAIEKRVLYVYGAQKVGAL
ncbi:MAG TPA: chemotaxis response regulator protein-glutamate methylesterase [Terriglobales bacterium]|nr:chemotaxis response regulator protein-glutamate methylesterase [Terriglobales bacterium]